MLYNPQLDTFIAVAESGSFSKAAEILYISSTAIMKQINGLEKSLGLTLLTRTPAGIELTESGKFIYKHAKNMVDYSRRAVSEARAIEVAYEHAFCIGSSLLSPGKPFMDLWAKLDMYNHPLFGDYRLHIVPFNDDRDKITAVMASLGVDLDFIMGICDSQAWLQVANFLKINEYPIRLALSRRHPLAKKEKLTLEDLYDYSLLVVADGDSPTIKRLREDLIVNHPKLHIEDVPFFYDVNTFNYAAESNAILLTLDCWSDVHPELVTIPIDWDYSIPGGILYAKNPTGDTVEFIDYVREHIPELQ